MEIKFICYRCGRWDFSEKPYYYLLKGREPYCSDQCLIEHYVRKDGIEIIEQINADEKRDEGAGD